MTAASPFAPLRRNSYLHHSHSSISAGGSPQGNAAGPAAAAVAFFLCVVKFWSKDGRRNRKELRAWLSKSSTTVLQWAERMGLFSLLRLEAPSGLITAGSDSDNDDDSYFSNTNINARAIFPHPEEVEATSTSVASQAEQTSVRRIIENQTHIRDVLQYWFGQHTPNQSQKNLWMIAVDATELRDRVDGDIAAKFTTILQKLSSSTQRRRWEEWVEDEQGIYGKDGKLAAIIVLDQFSRHIHRHLAQNNKNSQTAVLEQSKLDTLATKAAQLLVEHHRQEITCGMIPLSMFIFGLMPFRHASTIESVQLVQDCIDQCADMNGQLDAMLSRFRKATNRRMAILQDEARRTGKISSSDTHGTTNGDAKSSTHQDEQISDEAILEVFPFEADMSETKTHAVVKTMINFLTDQGIHPHTSTPVPIIVSLSGGVDSMVIASALAYLNQSCDYNLYVMAIHIDYANRPESGAEASYVQRYSERLGIQFQCRMIGEVTRGITARDDYERIAREIRYESYRDAIAQCVQESGFVETGSNPAVGVMLGHHRGDLRENVLSNAHKGCGPLDLSGMTAVSVNDGVSIYRPLLPLEKTFILDYAHKYGVPYFKDTTPHWSTRGKLRNKLLPLLEEIYGEGSMNNLSTLATESDECRQLLHNAMFEPFLKSVVRKPMGIIFETKPFRHHSAFFWKLVLRETLHSAGLGMFSDKSVVSFLERVTGIVTTPKPQRRSNNDRRHPQNAAASSKQHEARKANTTNNKPPTIKAGWLQCRKDYAVYMDDVGRIYVFYPSSFPFRKADMYKLVDGQGVMYGESNGVQVGPWHVSCSLMEDNHTHKEMKQKWLAQKATPSMESLMDGKVEYYLEVPSEQQEQLPFVEFTKMSRPMAWKNSDLKVQSILPLLGNTESRALEVSDPEHDDDDPVLVKVTLQINQPTAPNELK